jgi:hypothetical protein
VRRGHHAEARPEEHVHVPHFAFERVRALDAEDGRDRPQSIPLNSLANALTIRPLFEEAREVARRPDDDEPAPGTRRRVV